MAGDGGAVSMERRRARERRPEQLHWIAQARALAATLDLLPNALVLLDPGPPCRAWHANLAARRLLADAGGLARTDDLPTARDDRLGARLAALLDGCPLAGDRPRAPRPPAAASGRELTLSVRELDFGASRDLPVRRLVLVEARARGPDGAALAALCREFGLTPKEAEAALRLHATGSVAEIAAQARRSVHTVRTQLKSAMSKTRTRSQAGLVALVGDRLAVGLPPSAPSTPAG